MTVKPCNRPLLGFTD